MPSFMEETISALTKGRNIFFSTDFESEFILNYIIEAIYCKNIVRFEGESAEIKCKINYVPPYESPKVFGREIKEIILQANTVKGLRPEFYGLVMLDVSEWISHESELYFNDLLKFLFDKNDIWRYVFVVNDVSFDKQKLLYNAIIKYIQCQMINLIDKKREVYDYMLDKISEKLAVSIKSDIRKNLCDYIADNSFEEQTVENILHDISIEAGTQTISAKSLNKYIDDNLGIYASYFDEFERGVDKTDEIQILC